MSAKIGNALIILRVMDSLCLGVWFAPFSMPRRTDRWDSRVAESGIEWVETRQGRCASYGSSSNSGWVMSGQSTTLTFVIPCSCSKTITNGTEQCSQ
jgi:hypothetical protein